MLVVIFNSNPRVLCIILIVIYIWISFYVCFGYFDFRLLTKVIIFCQSLITEPIFFFVYLIFVALLRTLSTRVKRILFGTPLESETQD